MLRFGTKNLSEAAQRELILKSIMETINEHGLHSDVKRRLIEQATPGPKDWIIFEKPTYYDKYKNVDVTWKGQFYPSTPLIIQSDSSMGEASKILGEMMKAIGTDNEEGDTMIKLIKQISYNNYPAILWKLRNTGINGKKYYLLRDWLKQFIDSATRSKIGTGVIGSGGKGPIGNVRDKILGVKTAEAFNRHMIFYNPDEVIEA
jgi:hypothetical protein